MCTGFSDANGSCRISWTRRHVGAERRPTRRGPWSTRRAGGRRRPCEGRAGPAVGPLWTFRSPTHRPARSPGPDAVRTSRRRPRGRWRVVRENRSRSRLRTGKCLVRPTASSTTSLTGRRRRPLNAMGSCPGSSVPDRAVRLVMVVPDGPPGDAAWTIRRGGLEVQDDVERVGLRRLHRAVRVGRVRPAGPVLRAVRAADVVRAEAGIIGICSTKIFCSVFIAAVRAASSVAFA